MDGVEYLKASATAKKFGYTSDYVGQLCRGGKVRAKLVGRTWFVDPVSVEEHRGKKYQTQRSESNADTTRKTKTSRQGVKVAITNKAVTSLHTQKLAQVRNSRTLDVRYDADESDLLPRISRAGNAPDKQEKPKLTNKVSKSVVIRHVDAQNVPVRSEVKKGTKFAADGLPEVSLSGSIKVMDVTTEEVEAHEKAEEAHPVVSPVKSHTAVSMTRQKATPKSRSKQVDLAPATEQEPQSRPQAVASFTPASVITSSRPRFALRFAPVIATAVAILCVGLVFSASSMVVSSKGSLDSSVVFQAANVLDLLNR